MMRIVDFFMVLPLLMIIVVFVAIVPTYDIWTFSLIMAAFLWTGTARLIRSVAMQERELDYVNASRTLSTSHNKIIFRQEMTKLVRLCIVYYTLLIAI